jgi:hypothetical protein
MSAKSPFAVSTATAASTAAPTPGFASQLYVEGVGTLGPKQYAAIKSRDPDKPNVMFLEVGGTSDDGMKVEAVQFVAEMGKSTVTVSKGGERATLIFDEQQMGKTASGAPAGIPPGIQPGVRLPTMPGGRPIGFGPNPALNQPGSPFQRVRIMGQPQPPGMPFQPGGPQGINIRRRLQTIQSGQ